MAIINYDTKGIRNCAKSIEDETKKYTKARNELNSTVTEMNGYFSDPVQEKFVKKYNSDLKVLVENVEKLMKQYSQFLEDSAVNIEKITAEASSKIN